MNNIQKNRLDSLNAEISLFKIDGSSHTEYGKCAFAYDNNSFYLIVLVNGNLRSGHFGDFKPCSDRQFKSDYKKYFKFKNFI